MGSSTYETDTPATTTPNIAVINGKVAFYAMIDGKLIQFSASAKNGDLVLEHDGETLPIDNKTLHSSFASEVLKAEVYLSPSDHQAGKGTPFTAIQGALGL